MAGVSGYMGQESQAHLEGGQSSSSCGGCQLRAGGVHISGWAPHRNRLAQQLHL